MFSLISLQIYSFKKKISQNFNNYYVLRIILYTNRPKSKKSHSKLVFIFNCLAVAFIAFLIIGRAVKVHCYFPLSNRIYFTLIEQKLAEVR